MDLITFLLLLVLNREKNIKSDINPLSYVKIVNNNMVLTDVTSTKVRNVIASLKIQVLGMMNSLHLLGSQVLMLI